MRDLKQHKAEKISKRNQIVLCDKEIQVLGLDEVIDNHNSFSLPVSVIDWGHNSIRLPAEIPAEIPAGG